VLTWCQHDDLSSAEVPEKVHSRQSSMFVAAGWGLDVPAGQRRQSVELTEPATWL